MAMNPNGLTKDELMDLRDILIKASNDQLIYVRVLVEKEARKRYEVQMTKLMGYYGNEAVGYRGLDGKRTKVLPSTAADRFDKSVFQ